MKIAENTSSKPRELVSEQLLMACTFPPQIRSPDASRRSIVDDAPAFSFFAATHQTRAHSMKREPAITWECLDRVLELECAGYAFLVALAAALRAPMAAFLFAGVVVFLVALRMCRPLREKMIRRMCDGCAREASTHDEAS